MPFTAASSHGVDFASSLVSMKSLETISLRSCFMRGMYFAGTGQANPVLTKLPFWCRDSQPIGALSLSLTQVAFMSASDDCRLLSCGR